MTNFFAFKFSQILMGFFFESWSIFFLLPMKDNAHIFVIFLFNKVDFCLILLLETESHSQDLNKSKILHKMKRETSRNR